MDQSTGSLLEKGVYCISFWCSASLWKNCWFRSSVIALNLLAAFALKALYLNIVFYLGWSKRRLFCSIFYTLRIRTFGEILQVPFSEDHVFPTLKLCKKECDAHLGPTAADAMTLANQ
jgi:CDP-diglyceride synthetase